MRRYPPGRSANAGATSANSLCTISFERRNATARLRAWRSPRRPSVISCSAIGFTAFALVTVVLIRPCSITAPARFAYRARRWAMSRPSFLPERACLTLLAAPVVAPEAQAVLGEGLLDLLDRLLAEVRDRGELVLGLRDEVADRLDPDALEAVVRADAELELLDREVLHPAREPGLGADAVTGGDRLLAEALDLVDVGEDRELADEDLGRLGERVLRIDRPVGGDVEHQLVVIRPLPDARSLDRVRNAAHGREDRVDRDDADRVLRAAIELGGHVAAAASDRQRQLQAAAVREVRDLELRIEDLELRWSLDVGCGDDARPLLRDVHLDLRRVAVEAGDEILEVENDVGDVLADARQRRELVRSPLDLDRGDRSALERGEQHAAQRVSERVTEAAVERLDLEDAAVLVHLFVDDARNLEVHSACGQSGSLPFRGHQLERGAHPLLRIQLDDERLLNRRVDLAALGLLQHLAGEAVVVGLEPWSDGRHEIGRVPDRLLRRRVRRDGDNVVRSNLVARDVHAAAVHVEVAVAHELARLCARRREAETVDDVVEPRLQHPQKLLPGDAGAPGRLLVVRAELLLEQAVVAASLLLLAQLQQILA